MGIPFAGYESPTSSSCSSLPPLIDVLDSNEESLSHAFRHFLYLEDNEMNSEHNIPSEFMAATTTELAPAEDPDPRARTNLLVTTIQPSSPPRGRSRYNLRAIIPARGLAMGSQATWIPRRSDTHRVRDRALASLLLLCLRHLLSSLICLLRPQLSL